MEYLLMIVTLPVVVWAVDRCLMRGDFTQLVFDVIGERRMRRAKARRPFNRNVR